jgi:hypothetical protein
MHAICHRCGGELSTAQLDVSANGSHFCPHCGAPQLTLSEYAEALSTGAEDSGTKGGSAGSTGTLPPPRPNQIDWRLAIQSASLVAVIAAILGVAGEGFPNLKIFSFVWVISASLTTMAMYQRRRPMASMNLGIGVKIGIVVGVVLAFALGASISVGFVVARFGMHALAGFDAQIAQLMQQLIVQVAAKGTIPAEQLAFVNTVQFRTGYLLFAFGLVLFSVVVMSIFGGAVAGLLRSRRSSVVQ